jgi:hypothetical protein
LLYITNTPPQLLHNPSAAYLSDVLQVLLKKEMVRFGGINKLPMSESVAKGFLVPENNSIWERGGLELSPLEEIIWSPMNSRLGYSTFGAFVRGWGEVSQLLWDLRDDFESIEGEEIGRHQFL